MTLLTARRRESWQREKLRRHCREAERSTEIDARAFTRSALELFRPVVGNAPASIFGTSALVYRRSAARGVDPRDLVARSRRVRPADPLDIRAQGQAERALARDGVRRHRAHDQRPVRQLSQCGHAGACVWIAAVALVDFVLIGLMLEWRLPPRAVFRPGDLREQAACQFHHGQLSAHGQPVHRRVPPRHRRCARMAPDFGQAARGCRRSVPAKPATAQEPVARHAACPTRHGPLEAPAGR